MCTSSQFDHDSFRILLFRCDALEILLETAGYALRAPAVRIPRHTRAAKEITSVISISWNLKTYCLFTLCQSDSSDRPIRYYVVEICRPEAELPAGMQWIPVASLSAPAFEDLSDFAALQNSISTLERYRRGELSGPFGKLGWLQTVKEWVQSEAAKVSLRLTGEFCQLNASPTFSLVRFSTNGPAIWFKAVGEPNLREYPITLALSRYFPAHTPQVLATRDEWNGWLVIEVEGTHPDENSNLEVWRQVATTLADLQIASVGQTLHLLDIGCRDARVCSLLELIEPFFEMMAELMEQQTKESPPPLSRDQLSVLRTRLQDILSEAAESEIPNAIGRLDFNPGNIVTNHDRCVFLDWAEACAGQPFLTFQYLLQHLRRLRQKDDSWERTLTSAYLDHWYSFSSPGEVAKALRISPLLAVFAYAVCGDSWRNPASPTYPQTAPYLRSLVRRMKREADLLAVDETRRSVPCPG